MIGEKKEKGVINFLEVFWDQTWHALDYTLGMKYKADRNCLGVRWKKHQKFWLGVTGTFGQDGKEQSWNTCFQSTFIKK